MRVFLDVTGKQVTPREAVTVFHTFLWTNIFLPHLPKRECIWWVEEVGTDIYLNQSLGNLHHLRKDICIRKLKNQVMECLILM